METTQIIQGAISNNGVRRIGTLRSSTRSGLSVCMPGDPLVGATARSLGYGIASGFQALPNCSTCLSTENAIAACASATAKLWEEVQTFSWFRWVVHQECIQEG